MVDYPRKDEDKWLFYYSLPCTLGDLEAFKTIRDRWPCLTSREKVLEHFLGPHNIKTKNSPVNWMHLALPYKVQGWQRTDCEQMNCQISDERLQWLPNTLISRSFGFSQLITAMEYDILPKAPLVGDLILVHSLFIVDRVTEEEVKKFLKT